MRKMAGEEAVGEIDSALATCRDLYLHGRSAQALMLARAALERAESIGRRSLIHRSCTACGLLHADATDIATGLEYHVRSLRLMATDEIEISRTWNNVGLAFSISGRYESAVRAYQRAIDAIAANSDPVFSRYAACGNRANALYHLNEFEDGLRWAYMACQEMTPEFVDYDPHSAVFLQRNLVRLLVSAGRWKDAEVHVVETSRVADQVDTPRAKIAAATARAAYELAAGEPDVALTRLEQALEAARQVPAVLRDTLVCVIRAEDQAGHPERALARMYELSDHIYRTGIDKARDCIELVEFAGVDASERLEAQTRVHLVSQLGPPEAPSGWEILKRLSVGAALRMDPTGWHGARVGALTKALALACGQPPLRALEISLAAELHDIGLPSVPEGIVGKRDELNPAEAAAYHRHADAGAEILRDDHHPRISIAREIALYHHAWWDGSGYPKGVGGHRIPIAARLCAVADAYDERVCGLGPHRPMSMDSALGAISQLSGTQLDPQLVRGFKLVIRNETYNHGIDPKAMGLEGFQDLIISLQQDRGFV